MGFDQRTDLPFAISEVRGNLQFAFAADLHAHQALVPAFDDAAGTDYTLEGFAFAVGGIEFGAVFKPAGVVGGDKGAFGHGFTRAGDEVLDNQFCYGSHRLFQMQVVEEGALYGFDIGDDRFFARPGNMH